MRKSLSKLFIDREHIDPHLSAHYHTYHWEHRYFQTLCNVLFAHREWNRTHSMQDTRYFKVGVWSKCKKFSLLSLLWDVIITRKNYKGIFINKSAHMYVYMYVFAYLDYSLRMSIPRSLCSFGIKEVNLVWVQIELVNSTSTKVVVAMPLVQTLEPNICIPTKITFSSL